MKFISDQVYTIKRSHYEIVKRKKVRVIDVTEVKSIDIVPFKRWNKAARVKS